jgi:hypothetical protein
MSADASLDGNQKIRPEQVVLSRRKAQSVKLLLSDVRDLLDAYGPVWYSEELNQRLSTVLKMLEDEL